MLTALALDEAKASLDKAFTSLEPFGSWVPMRLELSDGITLRAWRNFMEYHSSGTVTKELSFVPGETGKERLLSLSLSEYEIQAGALESYEARPLWQRRFERWLDKLNERY